MGSYLANGVPPAEHPILDWEALRTFLDVARSGSFRAAAKRRRLAVNRIRRLIERLEQQLHAPLLLRNFSGVQLTPEGHHALEIAKQMEAAAYGLMHPLGRAAHQIEGEVKVAVTEGLGTFWLVPRLVEFQRAYPKLLIDLRCAMQQADLMRFEADVALQLVRPRQPDLKVVRVGSLHIMPFASQGYLDKYGEPKTKAELEEKHRVVFMIAEQGQGRSFYEEHFPGKREIGFVAMRSNTTAAHAWAVAKGAGIGWLPSYAKACGGRVVPLDLDMRFRLDIWLAHHPSAGRARRVRRVIDWITDNCNPRQFPWFRDEFIHPGDFDAQYHGPPLVNLFDGFLAMGEGERKQAQGL